MEDSDYPLNPNWDGHYYYVDGIRTYREGNEKYITPDMIIKKGWNLQPKIYEGPKNRIKYNLSGFTPFYLKTAYNKLSYYGKKLYDQYAMKGPRWDPFSEIAKRAQYRKNRHIKSIASRVGGYMGGFWPTRISRHKKGYLRTGGYYGRFSGRNTGGELKFHDIDTDDAVISSSGTIVSDSVVKIAQGTTEKTRIGRKCTIRKIQWKFNIILPTTATAADTCDIVRVVVYWDKQTNGATAAVGDLWESTNFQDFRNLANVQRFKILFDRYYSLRSFAGSGRGSTDTLSYGCHVVHDSFYKNVNIKIEYDSTAGAITEMRSNNIGIFTSSQAGLCAIDGKMRIRFSDS